MKIIILGGTGFIGRHICEKLVRAGHEVTVPTRKIENAREIQMLPRLQPLRCNVHDQQQLTQAVAGHDVLINLVAILHGSEQEFERVHVTLPKTIVAACKASGVGRIVQMSSLGAALDAPSQYLRSKGRGEQIFTQSGLDVSILRPSVVFGEGDKLLNVFAALQQNFPFVPLAGSDAQFQPVWVEDVAQAAVQLVVGNNYKNDSIPRSIYAGNMPKTFEITGNRVMSLRELFELAGQCVGASRAIVHLPDALARVQAWAMEKMPGPTLMSRDNLNSMKSPNVASGQLPGLRDLGIEPTGIEAIAPLYLRPKSRLDQYRKSASR
ncbi:complex I NDUFA9 subunit family protein [Variovorax sp. PCZ-1]|uniref:complex I NDUFA9 subunit family protein n=1 Tax=Variovorax sp. PCZ-1 TaxID=2835533 RepID=UPI001BCC2B10|nr:complex I NDUFA9 subunit family protein [Variovorax sp. PCZ-1]MBS7806631.1 complex I NDUFA9 subunit family protein [Variovorax sp. PCZ-1]